MKIRLALLALLVCLAGPALGATRFYLPSSGAPGVYPNFSTFWTNTSSADWVRMSTSKMNTAMTNKQTATISGTGYLLNRIYVSDPIGAQTISGTVYGYIRTQSLWTSKSYVIVKVVSGDGLTVRGTLFSNLGSNNWVTNTMTSRGYPLNSAVSAVTALEGDRIVIEIGAYKNDAASFAIINSFGDNNATDLPQNETTTTAYNPWVEFSQTITYATYTRFYLPDTGTAPASPPYHTTWTRTTEAERRPLLRTKSNTPFNGKSISPGSFTGACLSRQYVSEPLKAQTISGTIRGQIYCRKTAGPTYSCYNIVSARIVSYDGSTTRGYLISPYAYGLTWFTNQWTDRAAPRETTISTVTVQEGDRIVVEIGFYKYDSSNFSMQQEFGDPSATGDLSISETATTQLCPWIEIRGDIRMGQGGGVMII